MFRPIAEQTRRRDLRRRFGSTPPQPVQARRDQRARFYVVAVELAGSRRAPLLGPYASHMTALANLTRAERLMAGSRYVERGFLAIGTASVPRTVRTVFGR